MNKPIIRFACLIGGILTYNYLFWQQGIGINLPIFNILVLAAYFILDPKSLRSRPVQAAAAGVLLTSIPVILYDSTLCVFAHCISLVLTVGFAHQPQLRSTMFSLSNAALSWLSVPVNYIEGLGLPVRRYKGQAVIWFFLSRSFIPMLVFVVFYVIYRNANVHFAELSMQAWDFLFSWLDNISFAHVLFLILGLFIVTGILYRRDFADLIKGEASLSDVLNRKRIKAQGPGYKMQFLPMELRKEYRTAVRILVLVNILLFIVNIVDIKWVWLGVPLEDGFSLKQFVHEGTYLLILSILLSMGILMFFWRRNMNFFSENKPLKILSYVWLSQNFILCISVFMRNWHYIQFHGLAYKRIGVIFFLVLTAIGLFTLYRKIEGKKTGFYLWRINTWAAYALMVLAAFFNWNILIAKYNLNHKNPSGIDTDFYLEMSDSVLPLLYDNLDKVETQIQGHFHDTERWTHFESILHFKHALDISAEDFVQRQEKRHWQSWNLADAHTYAMLKNKPEEIKAEEKKAAEETQNMVLPGAEPNYQSAENGPVVEPVPIPDQPVQEGASTPNQ